MRVTGIVPTQKGRYSIFLDGEFACALHPDILAGSRLETGGEVLPAQMAELQRMSEEKITRERALNLLSQRSYTAKGLYDKLVRYADEDSAEKAVNRMIELGFIDDDDYARRYAADCMNCKGYSKKRAEQALLQKGIDRETALAALSGIEDDPEPAIAKLILSKYIRYFDDEKGLRKTTDALIRRGYRYGDIRRVMDNLAEDENYYDGWSG